MAGADVLDVEATAAKDDQVLNRWKTGSGSIVGGLIRPGMAARFSVLIALGVLTPRRLPSRPADGSGRSSGVTSAGVTW
jgi:hypothetical protein